VPVKSPNAPKPVEVSPTAEFEPAPAPVIAPRRTVERSDGPSEPPAGFGARPRVGLPVWVWLLVAASVAALAQLWAC
jgi:hypothetical protein